MLKMEQQQYNYNESENEPLFQCRENTIQYVD